MTAAPIRNCDHVGVRLVIAAFAVQVALAVAYLFGRAATEGDVQLVPVQLVTPMTSAPAVPFTTEEP